jgi:hypothetical protein
VPDVDPVVSDRAHSVDDVFLILATLLLVSPVLQPQHAIWLLPLLVLRPRGVAWFAFPGVVGLCYLTHLAGPQAADLTFMDGQLSYRAFGYGAFALLWLLDLLWKPPVDVEPDREAAVFRGVVGTEEEVAIEYPEYDDQPATFKIS